MLATAVLTWLAASDTHLGHDDGKGANYTTSYEKNVWAITEMNRIASNGTQWPPELGGGPVLEPIAVTVSGDLVDNGSGEGTAVNGCRQWTNFTALYGLNGTDGMLKYRAYEGRDEYPAAAAVTTAVSIHSLTHTTR